MENLILDIKSMSKKANPKIRFEKKRKKTV